MNTKSQQGQSTLPKSGNHSGYVFEKLFRWKNNKKTVPLSLKYQRIIAPVIPL